MIRLRRNHLKPLTAVFFIWLAVGFFVHLYSGDSPAKGHWNKRWWNDEASLHFLNTLGRYHHNPIRQHWFAVAADCVDPPDVPCTRTGKANKPGSAVVTSHRLNGEDVYISYPPGSMIISSAFVYPLAKVFDVTLLTSMRVWNWVLGLLTAVVFFFALDKLPKSNLKHRSLLIVLACVPLIISVESMHSHHLSLWAHQVMQPIIAGVLVALSGRMTGKRAFVLGLLCAIGGWVEWTAYLLCIAAFFVILWKSDRKDRVGNLIVFSITALAGGLSLLAYYSWLVGLEPYFTKLFVRFSERTYTVEHYDWGNWFVSLFQSYGAWIVASLALIVFWRGMAAKRDSKNSVSDNPEWLVAFFVVVVILLENVLMFEHSIVYTFDRLKWGFLFGVLVVFLGEKLISQLGTKGLALAAAPVVFASIASIGQFIDLYRPYWR